MSKKIVAPQRVLDALQEMVNDKSIEPVEEVLTVFCERYGLDLTDRRSLYAEPIKLGKS